MPANIMSLVLNTTRNNLFHVFYFIRSYRSQSYRSKLNKFVFKITILKRSQRETAQQDVLINSAAEFHFLEINNYGIYCSWLQESN